MLRDFLLCQKVPLELLTNPTIKYANVLFIDQLVVVFTHLTLWPTASFQTPAKALCETCHFVNKRSNNIFLTCGVWSYWNRRSLLFLCVFILQLPAPLALQLLSMLFSPFVLNQSSFSLFCVSQVTSRLVWWRKRASWRWKSSEHEDSYKSQDLNPSLVRT